MLAFKGHSCDYSSHMPDFVWRRFLFWFFSLPDHVSRRSASLPLAGFLISVILKMQPVFGRKFGFCFALQVQVSKPCCSVRKIKQAVGPTRGGRRWKGDFSSDRLWGLFCLHLYRPNLFPL